MFHLPFFLLGNKYLSLSINTIITVKQKKLVMKWFKTKEEKQLELQKELEELTKRYAGEINNYCKIREYLFILKGFRIENNQICVSFLDKTSVPDYTHYQELRYWLLKHETIDFKKARYQFVLFQEELRKIGLILETT